MLTDVDCSQHQFGQIVINNFTAKSSSIGSGGPACPALIMVRCVVMVLLPGTNDSSPSSPAPRMARLSLAASTTGTVELDPNGLAPQNGHIFNHSLTVERTRIEPRRFGPGNGQLCIKLKTLVPEAGSGKCHHLRSLR